MPRIPHDGIVDWLRSVQSDRAPLPAFRLVDPRELHITDVPVIAEAHQWGADALVSTQPGGYDIRLVGLPRFPTADSRRVNWPYTFEDTLMRSCLASDKREFIKVERSAGDKALVAFEVTSRVGGLPITGPGGRLTAYSGGEHITVELVIRKRLQGKAADSTWRSVEDIYGALQPALGRSKSMVNAEFGYFEASKLESQSLMRPAYVFNLEGTAESGLRWREVFVLPATVIEGVSDLDGVEGWVSEA